MPPHCRICRHWGFDAPAVAGAPWICSAWGSSRCAVERSPANGAPPHGAKPPPRAPQAPLALAECNPLVPRAPTPLPLEPCVILRRLARRAIRGRRGEKGCSTGEYLWKAQAFTMLHGISAGGLAVGTRANTSLQASSEFLRMTSRCLGLWHPCKALCGLRAPRAALGCPRAPLDRLHLPPTTVQRHHRAGGLLRRLAHGLGKARADGLRGSP